MDNIDLSGEEKLNRYISEHQDDILIAQEELAKRKKAMQPMRLKDVKSLIEKINAFLSRRTWMDFTYKIVDDESIILIGCIDLTIIEPQIEITFQYPQVIASPFFWTMDNNRPFIQLSSKEELKKKTGLYAYDDVYIFKLNDEQLEESSAIFITATGLQCKFF